MIGDRMDTDIVGAVSSGMATALVLTGVTKMDEVRLYPYQPTHILDSIADLLG
jgi:NagD protein